MEDTFYRLACRIKSNGRIARSADYHDLQTIQSQVKALNAERGQTCEYFVESVKLNALLPWEVVSLVEQNLINIEQLERYSKTNDQHRHIGSIQELIQKVQSKNGHQNGQGKSELSKNELSENEPSRVRVVR